MKRKVAVSQRVEVWADRGERRDALDQELILWLVRADCLPFPVPNLFGNIAPARAVPQFESWLDAVAPAAILLSGGNDIGEIPERDETEKRLLAYARERALPVLGICRGMQMMAICAGARLVPVKGHVRTRHRLEAGPAAGAWPDETNSFHNLTLGECPPGFAVTARAEDGSIEAIQHRTLPWEGWMWHPEREPEANPTDLARFRALLETGVLN